MLAENRTKTFFLQILQQKGVIFIGVADLVFLVGSVAVFFKNVASGSGLNKVNMSIILTFILQEKN